MRILKRNLAFVLALVMALSLTVSAANVKDYKDADDVTFVEAVDVLTSMGVLEGSDGSFNPTMTLNRAEAAKIISYLMLGKTSADNLKAVTAPFNDVSAAHWASGYIANCVNEGIIGGYGNGNFGPNDQLTATQFAKMLLCAVGYGVNGEFTGAGWEVEVNKLALSLGVYNGNLGVNFGAACTREEAALYAFNALTKVETVEYSELFGAYYTGDLLDKNVQAETLGQQLYNLSKVEKQEDAFGRNAHFWKKGSTTTLTGLYADTPDATYTASVKLNKIYSDLGLTVKDVKNQLIVDGGEPTTLTWDKSTKDTLDVSGKGVLVEAYVDEEENVRLVVINSYLGEVTKYDEDDEVVTVDVDGTVYTYETAVAYEEGDFVLVTVVGKEIETLKAAEVIEGELEAVASTYVKMDGVKYDRAKNDVDNTFDNIDFDNEYVLIVDENGCAVALDAVEEEEESTVGYVLVTDYEFQTSSLLTSKAAVVEVRYLDGEGTEVLNLDTKKVDGVYNFKDVDGKWKPITANSAIAKTFYAYTMTDEGEIVLKSLTSKEFAAVVDGVAVQSCSVKFDGTTTAMIGGTAYRVNSKTTVTVVDEDDNVKTYTGYKNNKFTVDNAYVMGVYVDDTDIIKELYVISGETSSTTDATVVYFTGETASVADGTEVEVYVDGQVEYYILAKDVTLEKGLNLVVFNEDSEIELAENADLEIVANLIVAASKTSYFKTADETYVYADDVAMYNVTDGIKTVSKISAKDVVDVVIDADTQEVVYVFIVK